MTGFVSAAYTSGRNIEKPFLRWAGGKQRQVNRLLKSLPSQGFTDYFEPFAGAASLFWSLSPSTSTLSDLNPSLILTYEKIKSTPKQVFERVQKLGQSHSESTYYSVRDHFNNGATGLDKVAAFIYMNRAGYNGVYRVNRFGEYNVPFGRHSNNFILPSEEHLTNFSERLQHTHLLCADFAEVEYSIKPRDLVYIDPPYTSGKASDFDKYTKTRFDMSNQLRLAEFARRLSDKGAYVLVSHLGHADVTDHYKGWHISRKRVARSVLPTTKSPPAEEVLISNYEQGNQ